MSNWVEYRIEKGHHVSEPMKIGLHMGAFPFMWNRTVIFDSTCSYDIGKDQSDINKLWGISQWNHMRNSFRFGWRWNSSTSKIEILPFITLSGKDNRLESEPIYSANIEESVQTVIILNQDHCIFSCQTKTYVHKFDKRLSPIRFGYFLRPYFGGNQVAPHTMKIYIR